MEDNNTELQHYVPKKKRRKFAHKVRPWYEPLKKRPIPKTEFNRKDVEESRRQKRSKKQQLRIEIEDQQDENY